MSHVQKTPDSAMHLTSIYSVVAVASITCGFCLAPCPAAELLPFDTGWRFHLGDVAGGERPDLDDSHWRQLDLPHDWSIEGATDPQASTAGGGGFFPTGVGWYRKSFAVTPAWGEGRAILRFDGVYQEATVWLNGQRLGEHAYGYTPFEFDLAPHLKLNDTNVIAVQVDNSRQPNSRWYSGSGIYRHVWLSRIPSLHLDPREVFLWTEDIARSTATVRANIAVRNDSDRAANVTVQLTLRSPARTTAIDHRQTQSLEARSESTSTHRLEVTNPILWSPDSPSLYLATINLLVDGQVVDTHELQIGIRKVELSAERGLVVNDEPLELIGGNVHHDNGPLGAAAFDRAEERRVEILKAAGFNAIRTAHNPPSPAFLDACDRLGMLVIDEAFDGWAKAKVGHDYSRVFADHWPGDLAAMVRRDRNHPSVILWSIGNEVYERGAADGARLAGELAARVRELDPTRPVTIGLNGLGKPADWPRLDRMFAPLDVAGYNYELHRHAIDHERLPNRMIYSSESFPGDVFADWSTSVDHPYVIGAFVWSALDYLGEAGIGRVFPPGDPAQPHWEGSHYPWHGAACGDIDLTGWRKPISHYRNIVWDRGEKLYAAVRLPAEGGDWSLSQWSVPPALPCWTWPGQEGRELTVDVYSRYDAVRLYLNDQSLGERPTTREHEFRAEFRVPYAPGTLRVVALRDGQEAEECLLTTAGPAAEIRLTPDRDAIRADRRDLSFVTVEIVDDNGHRCFDADQAVKYSLAGPGEIVAIGSGDLASTEPYGANPRRVFQGRALVVVRSINEPGSITLTATAADLADGLVELKTSSGGN